MSCFPNTQKLLTRKDEYQERHLRSLRQMIRVATKSGQLGHRPDGWLETVVFLGFGITMIDCRDKVIGFSVVRPMGVDQSGQAIAYGEASLWRRDIYQRDVQLALLVGAKHWAANELWGAYFRSNGDAAQFFADYDRMPVDKLPSTVRHELSRYEAKEIEYIRKKI